MPRRVVPLTVSFNETVRIRAARDPAFRAALFTEAGQSLLAGDFENGKAALRATIDATIGFERLAKATGIPVKSLMWMFGPKGNPQAKHLFTVLAVLQKRTGVRLEVKATARAKAAAKAA
jgi:DNA-binding phage protein